MNKYTLLITVIFVLLVVFVYNYPLHIFEDGSFAFGTFPYSFWGCIPWELCAK